MDTSVGVEICEELFTADSPHIGLGLDGVEIFTNGSASLFEVQKIQRRIALVNSATGRTGGVYLYANQHGTDGEGALYYDGGAMVSVNGQLVAQGRQFPLADVDVAVARVDLDDLRVYRGLTQSLGNQGAALRTAYPQVFVPFSLSTQQLTVPDGPLVPRVFPREAELALGPPCWLWDYLRKSGAGGFFLALSGGADSCACALLVFHMAARVFEQGQADPEVRDQVEAVLGTPLAAFGSAQELAHRLLHTAYMQTDHSSEMTRGLARELAKQLGAYHLAFPIDAVVGAAVRAVSAAVQCIPRFRGAGGTPAEGLALQNLQARLRMVLAYFCAQLLPVARQTHRPLLVLGTANLDEGLRGYFSKYDCSSGDLSPIGSLSKSELRQFIAATRDRYAHLQPVLDEILASVPSAELEPGHTQTDEADMGMTYADLETFGTLRGIFKSGPVTMFTKLAARLAVAGVPLAETAAKVKHFFHHYGINRHKMQTVTPALHATPYDIGDGRFDQRPSLYRRAWPWQFAKIDEAVRRLEEEA